MTTSTAPLPDLQRDDIIRAAFLLAGQVEVSQGLSAADISMATIMFRLLLDDLQGEGVILRTAERTTLTLTPGTSEYILDSDTIDVEVAQNGVAGMIIPSVGTGESPVMAMRADEWVQISNKQVGPTRPTQVYVEKLASVKLVFFPPPGSESAQFRYRKVRLLRDVDTGTVTQDLPSRWTLAVSLGLARLIGRAKSIGEERLASLKKDFEEAKTRVRREDVERGPTRLVLRYQGGRIR